MSCGPLETQRLAAFVQVLRVALAAVAGPVDGAPIVAVGRFHGDGSERAELALVVDDAHQHVGLGRLLLERLLREGARRLEEYSPGMIGIGVALELRDRCPCAR